MTIPTPPTINFTLDTQSPFAVFSTRLQLIDRRLRLVLHAIRSAESEQLAGVLDSIEIKLAPDEPYRAEDRLSAENWVRGLAIGDAIQAFDLLIDRSVELLALAQWAQKGPHLVPAGTNLPEFVRSQTREHRLRYARIRGPKRRLERLAGDYGVGVEWAPELLSINAARNCLVHRFGLVNLEADCSRSDSGHLVVKYRRITLEVHTPSGDRLEIDGPKYLPEGGQVVLAFGVPSELKWVAGTTVEIDMRTIQHLLQTIHEAGRQLARSVARRASTIRNEPHEAGK